MTAALLDPDGVVANEISKTNGAKSGGSTGGDPRQNEKNHNHDRWSRKSIATALLFVLVVECISFTTLNCSLSLEQKLSNKVSVVHKKVIMNALEDTAKFDRTGNDDDRGEDEQHHREDANDDDNVSSSSKKTKRASFSSSSLLRKKIVDDALKIDRTINDDDAGSDHTSEDERAAADGDRSVGSINNKASSALLRKNVVTDDALEKKVDHSSTSNDDRDGSDHRRHREEAEEEEEQENEEEEDGELEGTATTTTADHDDGSSDHPDRSSNRGGEGEDDEEEQQEQEEEQENEDRDREKEEEEEQSQEEQENNGSEDHHRSDREVEEKQQQQQQEEEPEQKNGEEEDNKQGEGATTTQTADSSSADEDDRKEEVIAAATAVATGPPPELRSCKNSGGDIHGFTQYSSVKMNRLCDCVHEITSEPYYDLPIAKNKVFHVHVGVSCQEVYDQGTLDRNIGTGNWVASIYAMRQAALATRRLELTLNCTDAVERRDELILPWLTGHFPLPNENNDENGYPAGLPSWRDACDDFSIIPLASMFPFIREELRRMAVSIVGVPSTDHPSAKFVQEQQKRRGDDDRRVAAGTMQLPLITSEPIRPGVELDDVALHFRCGDLISDGHDSLGFMKFKGYADCIPEDAKSIGILTQPFEKTSQLRAEDSGEESREICKRIVSSFVEYLQGRFPRARVTIRNDESETIAMAYARMVMAKVVVVGVSAFGVFPAIANFGVGYIKRPEDFKPVGGFLLDVPPDDDPEVKLIDPQYLPGDTAKAFREAASGGGGGDADGDGDGVDFLIEWLRDDDGCARWDNNMTPVIRPCKSIANVGEILSKSDIANDIIEIKQIRDDRKVVREWENGEVRLLLKYSAFKFQRMCDHAKELATLPRTDTGIVHLSFSCNELFTEVGAGSGNWITSIYAMRQTALASRRLEFNLTCNDAEEHKDDLIMPWLMGHFPLMEDLPVRPKFKKSFPPWQETCEDYLKLSLVSMFPFIREELRRLAVATVGIPGADHPAAKFLERHRELDRTTFGGTMQLGIPEKPTHPDVELDEVALHFRCGDLVDKGHQSFGFMKFKGYTDCIPEDTKTIGILTQPFGKTTQLRKMDAGDNKVACRNMAHAFVDYIEERFPKARVRIHNDESETIALAYARMVMAKVVVASVSTFSVYPAIANFGVGYVKRPRGYKPINHFILDVPPDDPNVKVIDPHYMPANVAKLIRQTTGDVDFLVEWLRNDTACATWDDNTPIMRPCSSSFSY